ncbi:cell wall metabolism sensor histidine kinase WalK [Streptomyces sp. TBY4]|uniref:sensor histidine kinase n=1 Tax=Streptomyces sp. TBY4 TaxID=2962030 RepID=UPI0020B67F2F|nr:HAMP domain-containing sensor histidine kinase [Streptomyces sp. TBY4]MCP3758916.1 HAMP domain-containing histidine kinase [Streptomyces sp. TBY4]
MPRLRRWRHWTLRSRLVVVSAALTALALIGANTAGVILLRSYLIDRVDRQLAIPGMGGQQQRLVRSLGDRPAEEQSARVPGDSFLSGVFGDDSRIYVYGQSGVRAVYPEEAREPGPALPAAAELAEYSGAPFTVPGKGGGSGWRVVVKVVEPTPGLDDGGFIVTAVSLAQVEETTDRLLLIDAAVVAGALALLGVGATFLVRVGLRPLTRMEATAGFIAAGDLSQRVADTDPHTEPGRLGGAMNAMLGRVEHEMGARAASELKLRRFLADASHELRTPLTSIRGFAELYRRGGDPVDAMRRIEAEAARMGVLVEDLLMLARLDEQRVPQQLPVDLLELTVDVARALHARSTSRVVRIVDLDESGGLIEPMVVIGDPLQLRQVLGNLLANADRHTPPSAVITIRLGPRRPNALGPAVAASGTLLPADRPAAVIEVADTGPGVPPRDAPYVFERLYRADPARSGGGAGLGLSIAAAIVAAHGGRLDLAAQRPGTGATFRVGLPLL